MIGALLALLLVQEPPPPPPVHARYGPLTQCLGGYAVTASTSDAILAMDGGVTLFSETGGFNIRIDDGDPYRSQQRRADIELAGLGQLIRYQRTYYPGSAPEISTTYLIPARDGHPAMLVQSGGFDGTERDLAVLGRITRVAGEQGCGNFRNPAYPGETPDAELWQPASTPGPFYRCQNGIGFPVLIGEALQSAWYGTIDGPAVRLSVPDPRWSRLGPIHLVVHGPPEAPIGTGAVAASYRHAIENWSDGPNFMLVPPRQASERHGPNQSFRHLIRIAYPPGQEAAAQAFANRIEFVERTDPRCHTD